MKTLEFVFITEEQRIFFIFKENKKNVNLPCFKEQKGVIFVYIHKGQSSQPVVDII